MLDKVQHINFDPLLGHAPPIKSMVCEVSLGEALMVQTGPQPMWFKLDRQRDLGKKKQQIQLHIFHCILLGIWKC
jgi:hypothetical protein